MWEWKIRTYSTGLGYNDISIVDISTFTEIFRQVSGGRLGSQHLYKRYFKIFGDGTLCAMKYCR